MAYRERGRGKILDRPPHHRPVVHRPATPASSFANAHAGHGATPSPHQISDLQHDAHVHQAGGRYAPRLGPVPAVERQGAVQVAVPGVVQRLQRAVAPSDRQWRREKQACQTSRSERGCSAGGGARRGRYRSPQQASCSACCALKQTQGGEQGRHQVRHRTRHTPWDTLLLPVWMAAAYSACNTWHAQGRVTYSLLSLFLLSFPFFYFRMHTHSSLITSLVRPR